MTKRKTVKRAPEPMCYCGPDINHIRSLTVFETIPSGLQEVVAACPAVQKLIVPVKDMSETRKRSMTIGTAEYACYQAIRKFSSKGGIRNGL